ncbi:MAG TPA: Druantia anti-phage system protein DruA [Terriglobia bacterium]|nr:Druantia anti-phage system protein DruA [Terriglobia bacterium]
MPATIAFCGHQLSAEELRLIRDTIHDFPALSLTELSRTICELLDWRRPTGALKDHECYLFLQRLKDRGWLSSLPSIRRTTPLGPRIVVLNHESDPQSPILGSVAAYAPLEFDLISDAASRALFRQYIQRYHYLGYRVPFGAQLRYFVRSQRLPERILACLLFSSAAWKMAPRDRWIGWRDQARSLNLARVVSNSRFLILPWVEVSGLASKILSMAAQQLSEDWLSVYQVSPLLLESLVDPQRFSGTCYRAANWIHVGTTQGRGRMDRKQDVQRHVKEIFIYPLHAHARELLCRMPETRPT